jgi:hypothetical protein
MPGREPDGYWEKLQTIGPQPLVEAGTLETDADWLAAGERVFTEWVVLRTFDPTLMAMARSRQALEERGAGPLPDGTINNLRWLPTETGVALGFANCSGCHVLFLPDGTPVPGAPSFAMPNGFRNALGPGIRAAERTLPGEVPFAMGGPSFGQRLYQAYGAPWTGDPAGERLKTMTEAEFAGYVAAGLRRGRRGAMERQHPLSNQDPRRHRLQGPRVHRSHRHTSASRHR